MQLYHFTSLYHSSSIAKSGLTVGDVPTDIDQFKEKIDVWVTSSPTPDDHGLAGARVDMTQFRLLVDVPELGALRKWSSWAPGNVTERTMPALRTVDGFKEDKYYIYFGWIRPERILDVIYVPSGKLIPTRET